MHQIPDAQIGRIKLVGLDERYPRPRITRLVSAAGIVPIHIRIKTGHNLDDRKTFSNAIGSQTLKVLRARRDAW